MSKKCAKSSFYWGDASTPDSKNMTGWFGTCYLDKDGNHVQDYNWYAIILTILCVLMFISCTLSLIVSVATRPSLE